MVATTTALHSLLLSPSRRTISPNPRFLSLPSPTRIRHPVVPVSTSTASDSTAYNYSGWDDLALSEPDGADPIQDLLVWIGIRNGKSGVVFLLGFLSALVVARVRLSPFTFLPVSVLVFLAGFAVGIAREGVGSRVEKIRVSDERSRVLRGIIGELDEKVEELRSGLLTIRVSGRMQGVKLRKSIDIAEYLKIKLANASRVVEKDLSFSEIVEGDRKLNSKLAQKRATFEAVASDVVRYFGSLIEENIGELGRKKKVESLNELPEEGNLKREESFLNSRSSKVDDSKLNSLNNVIDYRKSEPAYSNVRSYNQKINDVNSSRLERTVLKHIKYGSHKAGFIRESKGSSLVEQTLEIHNRSYKFKFEEIGERDLAERNSETQDRTDSNLDFDDEEFNRNLKEASDILATARECLKINADEEKADALLYKASSLLTTAVSLKPSCLVAIGQLGNAYLLHGELKLKMSRELRGLLANRDDSRFKRAEVGSALVDACEECENLLIEAGKNYRKALTIDANDAKALYNWGLALSFRAQLLSDIGPEASLDADKIYLAAIDKFDAMLSRNNAYAPEALYRWGMTLQQRSHLRQHNNKEKVKLLQQAKCLFEEVLFMEADNLTVQDALSSCISELQYHDLWL